MRNIEEITLGLKDAGQPLEDVATAGQPEAEHFERLAETGYKTVVDMRAPEEDRGLDEPEIVRRSGMEYVSIPVGHETVEDETFERFRELMRIPNVARCWCTAPVRTGWALSCSPTWCWIRADARGGGRNGH